MWGFLKISMGTWRREMKGMCFLFFWNATSVAFEIREPANSRTNMTVSVSGKSSILELKFELSWLWVELELKEMDIVTQILYKKIHIIFILIHNVYLFPHIFKKNCVRIIHTKKILYIGLESPSVQIQAWYNKDDSYVQKCFCPCRDSFPFRHFAYLF